MGYVITKAKVVNDELITGTLEIAGRTNARNHANWLKRMGYSVTIEYRQS